MSVDRAYDRHQPHREHGERAYRQGEDYERGLVLVRGAVLQLADVEAEGGEERAEKVVVHVLHDEEDVVGVAGRCRTCRVFRLEVSELHVA